LAQAHFGPCFLCRGPGVECLFVHMGGITCCMKRDPAEGIPSNCMPTKSATASTFWVPNNRGRCIEDEYEVLNKPIGAGNYGTVKIVISRRCGSERALKNVQKTSPDMEMLRTEVDVNLTLDHPNIVKLFNVFEDRQYVYLVFELCQGHDLEDIGGAPLSLSSVGFIMDKLLKALRYLHEQCIVHRDVKPSNLVLKNRDVPLENNAIKLIDFGMAGRCTPGQKSLKTVGGTPFYVAPEIWRRDMYDEKCDIWSAGVTMYELLSTVLPFAGEDVAEQSMLVTTEDVTFDYYTWKNIDSGTKDFIKQLLTKDPDKRVSAGAAHQHEWIRFHVPTSSAEGQQHVDVMNSKMCDNMTAFGSKSRFEKAAITLVAHLLDDSEIQDLQLAFEALDTDGNGKLNLQEIQQALKETKVSANLQEVFEKVGFNGSSEIEYSTFIASMMDQKFYHKQEHLWRAFKAIDQDNNNCITVQQLSQALKHLDGSGAPVSSEEIQSIMQKSDTDGDGLISFEEFSTLICGSPAAANRKAQPKLNQRCSTFE